MFCEILSVLRELFPKMCNIIALHVQKCAKNGHFLETLSLEEFQVYRKWDRNCTSTRTTCFNEHNLLRSAQPAPMCTNAASMCTYAAPMHTTCSIAHSLLQCEQPAQCAQPVPMCT